MFFSLLRCVPRRLTVACCFSGLVLSAADPNGSFAGREPESGLLARAAAANRDLYSTLQSFVCGEQIERYRGHAGSAGGKHIDTVTAKVSLENGTETYSDIQQKKRPIRELAELGGAWSEGEFGTLLMQTEQLLRTQRVSFEGQTEVNGAPAVLCRFDVLAADSPWHLAVSGENYLIPFHTEVWIAAGTGQILTIARTSNDLPGPLGIAQIDWGVTLSAVTLNGKSWLLPGRGEYQVTYRNSGRREWNTMTFEGYRRYGSEVALSFN